jgi:hypothetical protein
MTEDVAVHSGVEMEDVECVIRGLPDEVFGGIIECEVFASSLPILVQASENTLAFFSPLGMRIWMTAEVVEGLDSRVGAQMNEKVPKDPFGIVPISKRWDCNNFVRRPFAGAVHEAAVGEVDEVVLGLTVGQ